MTGAQCGRLLSLRTGVHALGGELVELREQAGWVGATMRGTKLRRDGGDVEILILPGGQAGTGLVCVPEGERVPWEAVEQQHATEAIPGSGPP
jgi:hypothetical protein